MKHSVWTRSLIQSIHCTFHHNDLDTVSCFSLFLYIFSSYWHQTLGYWPTEFSDHHDEIWSHQVFQVHGLSPQVQLIYICSPLHSLKPVEWVTPLTVNSLLPVFPRFSPCLRKCSANWLMFWRRWWFPSTFSIISTYSQTCCTVSVPAICSSDKS